MSSHRLPHLLVAVACTGALVGCSNAGDPTGSTAAPGVASLTTATTPGAGPAQTAADPNDSRPLIRADTSKEERDRLQLAFEQCEIDHGVPKTGKAGMKPGDDTIVNLYRAADAACLSKTPEDYTERERRHNPGEWEEHVHKWVGCLKQHGLHVAEVADGTGEGWAFTDDGQAGAEMDSPWVDTCQRQQGWGKVARRS